MRTHAWEEFEGAVVAERYTLRALLYAGKRQAEFLAFSIGGPGPGPDLTISLFECAPEDIELELARVGEARRLQHPNLLRILDGGKYSFGDAPFLYIATEANDGTLAELLAKGPLPDTEVLILLSDLVA